MTSTTLERSDALYEDLSTRLNSPSNTLQDRFRALFTLKSLCDERSIDIISECYKDKSVLLKHELGYVLGQMRHPYAINKLTLVLKDSEEDLMVRHEAGEALGAIGSLESIPVLEVACLNDPSDIIKETCQLSLERIHRLHDPNNEDFEALKNAPRLDLPFISIDPAVGCAQVAGKGSPATVKKLEEILVGEAPLYERYRAMFSLRNLNCPAAVLALTKGFQDKSALFRHEVAYVLGQLADPIAIPALASQLALVKEEHPMVRHECAEALGAIATEEANACLILYLNDPEIVVKESVLVALDILEHEQSSHFQYATAAATGTGNCSFKVLKESK